MLYEVKNKSAGTRIIYDARGKAVSIEPGGTSRPLALKDSVLDRIRESSTSLEIAGEIDDVDPDKVTRSFDHDGDGRPGGSLPASSDEIKKETARDLLALVDDLEFHEFLRRAKVLVGEDWPGGQPKKRDIVLLLEDKARDEEEN